MKRGDIAIALCLLAVAGGLLLVRRAGPGTVYVNGMAASESTQVNSVSVEISGNRARVKSSPCGDQLCVKAGWLERSGDVAVCLPQNVIVELRVAGNRAAGTGVDSIAY